MYIPGLKNKFKIIRIIFRLYYIFCILMLLVGVSQDIIQGIVIFLLLIIPVYIFSGLLRGIKHYKDKCWLWCNLVCPFIAFILCCIVFLSYNERLVLDAANNLAHAAEIMSSTPGALHLRTLSTLNDLSSDQSNTIIFAIPIEVLRAFEGTNVKDVVQKITDKKN